MFINIATCFDHTFGHHQALNEHSQVIENWIKLNYCTLIKCCVDGYNFNNLIFYTQQDSLSIFLFSLALQPPWTLPSNFQFHDRFADVRTLWTSNQLVSRPLPKHRTTQTHKKHIHIPNIYALCGIRAHDSGLRASEDSTCLRPLDYRDRP
jgi:hypothetical protein